LSVLKPGDYMFIQFGHNDQKELAKRLADDVKPFDPSQPDPRRASICPPPRSR